MAKSMELDNEEYRDNNEKQDDANQARTESYHEKCTLAVRKIVLVLFFR